MEDHAKLLWEALKLGSVCYALAYKMGGGTDVGVRGYPHDTVVVQGKPWLICGDICDATSGDRLNNIRNINTRSLRSMRVHLSAQSYSDLNTIKVNLGTYEILERIEMKHLHGGVLKFA